MIVCLLLLHFAKHLRVPRATTSVRECQDETRSSFLLHLCGVPISVCVYVCMYVCIRARSSYINPSRNLFASASASASASVSIYYTFNFRHHGPSAIGPACQRSLFETPARWAGGKEEEKKSSNKTTTGLI